MTEEDFESIKDAATEDFLGGRGSIAECVARQFARHALRRLLTRARIIVAISHRTDSPRSFPQALGWRPPC